MLLAVSSFFVYFGRANASFASGAVKATDLPAELARWWPAPSLRLAQDTSALPPVRGLVVPVEANERKAPMLKSLLYTGPSLETLRAYAKQGRIDSAAAIQSRAEILIRAPAARVWSVLVDAAAWPLWMPGVTVVRLDSSVVTDATFSWKSGSSTIRSTFVVVDPPRELTWTGVSSGVKAIDRHTLTAAAGSTRVFTEESMAGPLVGLFFSSHKLHAAQQAYLAALQRFVEQAS